MIMPLAVALGAYRTYISPAPQVKNVSVRREKARLESFNLETAVDCLHLLGNARGYWFSGVFNSHLMGDQCYAPDCTFFWSPGVVAPPYMEWPCRVVALVGCVCACMRRPFRRWTACCPKPLFHSSQATKKTRPQARSTAVSRFK
jgi:hypothetical protein